ncbi:hypothetical protein DM558_12335 [Entomomonas moraniae]|uniref:Uncharacterized protein n=1 Tax=Entomomonas moraniae TaxID=2213226 RepID=A0A451ENZ8_9GAMM|nr:hypothetical protein [Entomomonas moraniae]AZS51508.1 hypothetical protein DM558_12335 [Entomomonas moraniae]
MSVNKRILEPDLTAEIAPRKGAAGFLLGEELRTFESRVGSVKWFNNVQEALASLPANEGWIAYSKELRNAWHTRTWYDYIFIYKNDILSLCFNSINWQLYEISVGEGYLGKFNNVKVGDDLLVLEDYFELDFDDGDRNYLIMKDNVTIEGISFRTDCLAALEYAPKQKIEYIIVANWDWRSEID